MNQSVLIVVGTAVAYRAFYAMRELSTRDGRPLQAIFGFIRMVRQLEAHWRPDRVVVAFDGGSPAHRIEKCPAYKAQRAPMPEDLRAQLPAINDYLDAAGIPWIRLNGQEADDVMATLAVRAARDGDLVRVATSDKDLMQLVDERIRLVPPTKAESELDADGVRAKTGVAPGQIVDWLALIGDAADNIPGVDGIGPKTATRLLDRFGSLEACFDQADRIESPSLRAKLLAGQDTARLNVELMTLDRDVPGVPPWADLPAPRADTERLRAFYERHDLHRFAAELADRAVPAPAPVARSTDGQMSLF